MPQPVSFIAEIKRTSQVKKASLDNEYQVVLVTDNSQILDLGKLPPDETVRVVITLNSDHSPIQEGIA